MAQEGRVGRRAAGLSAVAVAVGVVGVLGVVALVLRPAEGLLHSGVGPFGRRGVVVIVVAVGWTVGVMWLVERLRPRVGAGRGSLSSGEERLRGVVARLLIGGPVAIGVLALVLHRFSRGDTASRPPLPLPTQSPAPVPDGPTMTPRDHGEGAGHDLSLPLYLLLGLLAAVLVVIVAVTVVRRLRRVGLRVPRHPELRGDEAEDDDARLLLSAVRSGRRALAGTGDARAAVIACYAAMEDALVASGIPRHASDSPSDLLGRAVGAGLTPGPAAPRLTALFREARYSSHPMGAPQREAAAEALEEIAALLQERRESRERQAR